MLAVSSWVNSMIWILSQIVLVFCTLVMDVKVAGETMTESGSVLCDLVRSFIVALETEALPY